MGLRYVDENASRYPHFPLEPLFRAIYTIKPDYDPKQVDLVTDRNNLRKLMHVISATRHSDFRIDMELVGNTLLFERWEKFDREDVDSKKFTGFGKQFEKNMTLYPANLTDSGSNHRIIQCSLGQLTVLLRFLGKACLPETELITSPDEIDQSSSAIQAIQLNASGAGCTNLRVNRGGVEVAHQELVELKSRALKNWLDFKDPDFMFQLWIAQVQHLKLGYYVGGGKFNKIEYKNFRREEQFEKFEVQNEQVLKKLVALIERIKETVREHGSKRAVLLYENDVGKMCIYTHDARTEFKHLLPTDLLSKWES